MSLTTKQREQLYDACRGDKLYPDCNICLLPISAGQSWHESHNPHLPKALGGLVDGIAHQRCNLDHAHRIDIPLIAKIKRVRQKFIRATVASRRPLPGGRGDNMKKRMDGTVVDRRTGLPFDWKGGQ